MRFPAITGTGIGCCANSWNETCCVADDWVSQLISIWLVCLIVIISDRLLATSNQLWQLLHRLDQLNASVTRFSRQSAAIISSYYYVTFVALVELLFLLADHRTHPFLVWLGFAIASYGFTITCCLFYAYSFINSGVR